jgi:uncharacterized protein
MQKSFDRRNFIKLSASVAAGGFLAGNGPLKAAGNYTSSRDGIIYRTLGKTGLKVPLVNLGFVRSDNPRFVNLALDLGMTLIDTAYGYSNGRNEEMLGPVLKNRPRDSYYLATRLRGNTEEQIMEQFETSLRRLQLDYVDILGIHASSSREHALDEVRLNTLTKIKKQGRARFLSISTHSNEPEVVRAAAESNVYDVVFTSYNFKMENYHDIKQAVAEAASAGLGVVAMKTMAGVYWDKERTDPINIKAALKYALQNPNIHTTIPGIASFQELEDNFEVNRDISMSVEEINDLRLDGAEAGLFCLGCQQCLEQCSARLPIPDLMRSYMYAYGYKDLRTARETLDSAGLSGDACSDCGSCSVKCVQGFNVAGKIKDISRLRHVPADFLT